MQLDADNPMLQTDKIHFLNILTNLLDNAVKYSGREPEIKVTTHFRGNKFVLSVRDNGIGFAEEIKHQIFEPFFTTKSPGIGTGLGLFISYSIVKKHKGQLTVESSVGKGSVFRIKIPRKYKTDVSVAS